MNNELNNLLSQHNWKFRIGDKVHKPNGANWSGTVVGIYTGTFTEEGYAVESDKHTGVVQIYPAKALELCKQQ